MLPLFDDQKTAPSAAPLFDIGAAFEEFWAEWPRKTGKDAARPKYTKALMAGDKPMAETHAAIMSAVRWQKHKPTWNKLVNGERVYCPHPATWLHQGRYNDPRPPGFKIPSDRVPQPTKIDPRGAARVLELRASIDHRNHLEAMEKITSGEIYREFPRLPPGSMKVRPCDCWKCVTERGES
jgi:hypothetical protein